MCTLLSQCLKWLGLKIVFTIIIMHLYCTLKANNNNKIEGKSDITYKMT